MWSSSRRSIYDDRKIKNERSDTIQYDSSSDGITLPLNYYIVLPLDY